jgi:hypothetical protein
MDFPKPSLKCIGWSNLDVPFPNTVHFDGTDKADHVFSSILFDIQQSRLYWHFCSKIRSDSTDLPGERKNPDAFRVPMMQSLLAKSRIDAVLIQFRLPMPQSGIGHLGLASIELRIPDCFRKRNWHSVAFLIFAIEHTVLLLFPDHSIPIPDPDDFDWDEIWRLKRIWLQ